LEPATRLLLWSCLLSIAILTDFHHDRIKDSQEIVVMQFSVFIKLLHRKCTSHYKVNTVIKKNPNGAICTEA
jgi:hypothetical protein